MASADVSRVAQGSNGKALVTLDVGAITEKAWLERREWSAMHTPSVKIPKLPTAMWADSERIGILRMGLDQWYEYAPDSDLAVLCARIMKDIARFAVPFMEKRVPSKKWGAGFGGSARAMRGVSFRVSAPYEGCGASR